MYYGFELSNIPLINSLYTVTRNTVWQITDKFNILIFINEGRCELSSDGETCVAKKGDLFFVPKNHSYIRKPVNGELCTMTYIHFDTDSEVSEYTMENLYKILADSKDKITRELLQGETDITYMNTVFLQHLNTPLTPDKIQSIFSDMLLYMQKKSVTSGINLSVSLCTILAHLSQTTINTIPIDTNMKKNTSPVPKKLKRAIGYIMQNYSEQISLDELSDFCNVSKQQLIRYFKSELNTTPLKYITDYKITRAKELLFNYPNLSINEISTELGFDNQHYFSKIFMKTTGETPSHYRYRTINYDDIQASEKP